VTTHGPRRVAAAGDGASDRGPAHHPEVTIPRGPLRRSGGPEPCGSPRAVTRPSAMASANARGAAPARVSRPRAARPPSAGTPDDRAPSRALIAAELPAAARTAATCRGASRPPMRTASTPGPPPRARPRARAPCRGPGPVRKAKTTPGRSAGSGTPPVAKIGARSRAHRAASGPRRHRPCRERRMSAPRLPHGSPARDEEPAAPSVSAGDR
jgi:hypothetical protein